MSLLPILFFFNDTATTEIYTLSLHDALPISRWSGSLTRLCSSPTPGACHLQGERLDPGFPGAPDVARDRKSTRLNSSHANISYAVFCLKKKKKGDLSESHDNTIAYTK